MFSFLSAFICIIVSAQEDAEGCKDNPMFNRMPGTYISECSSNYDEMEIIIGDDKKEMKEGKKTSIVYIYEPEEATAPSFFQIVKNFENVILKAGGKKIYYNRDGGVATFKTRSAGKDVWVVLNDFGGHTCDVAPAGPPQKGLAPTIPLVAAASQLPPGPPSPIPS